jgi:hypothetical protein
VSSGNSCSCSGNEFPLQVQSSAVVISSLAVVTDRIIPNTPPPPSGSAGTPGSSDAARSRQPQPPSQAPQSSSQKDKPDRTAGSNQSKSSQHVTYEAWMTTETRTKPLVSEEHVLEHDTGLHDVDPLSTDEDVDDYTAPYKPIWDQWWKSYTRRDCSPTAAVTTIEEVMSTWWKPDDAEKGSSSPEPEWMITSEDQFVPDNNWANTVAENYVPPPANSLLAQTGDMGAFIQWYCKKRGLPKLTKKDL